MTQPKTVTEEYTKTYRVIRRPTQYSSRTYIFFKLQKVALKWGPSLPSYAPVDRPHLKNLLLSILDCKR